MTWNSTHSVQSQFQTSHHGYNTSHLMIAVNTIEIDPNLQTFTLNTEKISLNLPIQTLFWSIIRNDHHFSKLFSSFPPPDQSSISSSDMSSCSPAISTSSSSSWSTLSSSCVLSYSNNSWSVTCHESPSTKLANL